MLNVDPGTQVHYKRQARAFTIGCRTQPAESRKMQGGLRRGGVWKECCTSHAPRRPRLRGSLHGDLPGHPC